MWRFPLAALLLRRSAADGGCAAGWTQIDDACFRVTEGSQSFSESRTTCSSLHANADLATLVHGWQNVAAAKLLNESSWIGWKVEAAGSTGSWVDGSMCRWTRFDDWDPPLATGPSCLRLLSYGQHTWGLWHHKSCDKSSPALCSYPLGSRNCSQSCSLRYNVLEGYCEPNSFSATLCSLQSVKSPQAATCAGDFAPNNMPNYGDWSRETGFAYLHPDTCDEACLQTRCNNDPACEGYTWAVGVFDGRGAGSLKSSITTSTSWGGYQCKVKTGDCAANYAEQSQTSTSSSLVSKAALIVLLLSVDAGHGIGSMTMLFLV